MDLNDPAQRIAFENLRAATQELAGSRRRQIAALRDRLLLEGYEDEFRPHRFVVYRGAPGLSLFGTPGLSLFGSPTWYVARQSSPRQAIAAAPNWAQAHELATRLAYDRKLWAALKNRPTVYHPAYREVI